MNVDVGDKAVMPVPDGHLEWHMRYGDALGHRYEAASVIAAYKYLINECSRGEIWRRVKLLRAAQGLKAG